MKTRSYIRYLFHSSYLYLPTHTHTRTQRSGYNSSIVPKGVKRVIIIIHKRRPGLGLADQRHGNPKDREGSRGRMKMVNRRNLEVACRGYEYRGGSIALKGLKYHPAFRCSMFYEQIWPYERGGWWIWISILLRKFIICYVFVIRSMEIRFLFSSPPCSNTIRISRRIFV